MKHQILAVALALGMGSAVAADKPVTAQAFVPKDTTLPTAEMPKQIEQWSKSGVTVDRLIYSTKYGGAFVAFTGPDPETDRDRTTFTAQERVDDYLEKLQMIWQGKPQERVDPNPGINGIEVSAASSAIIDDVIGTDSRFQYVRIEGDKLPENEPTGISPDWFGASGEGAKRPDLKVK